MQYIAYLRQFDKPTPLEAEILYRSKLFASYLVKMERHNADGSKTWKMGVNKFSNLTPDEFQDTYLGELPSYTTTPATFVKGPVASAAPRRLDWR
jgi:hypothetical protein